MRYIRLTLLGMLAAVLLAVALLAETPVPVSATPPVVLPPDLSSGGQHSCMMTMFGEAKCWGRNHFGQLGDGSHDDSGMPVTPLGLGSGVVDVEAGAVHSCAILAGGGAKCWGSNEFGELGIGVSDGSGSTGRTAPLDVIGLSGAPTAMSLGFKHTCALIGSSVQCWGLGGQGQLGDGTGNDSSVPVDVLDAPGGSPLTGVVAINARDFATCALMTGGTVKCWGDGYAATPLNVAAISNAVAITSGANYSCVLTSVGGVKCWGDNTYGQLGNPMGGMTPSDVVGLTSGVAQVSAENALTTCALLAAGSLKCWGANFFGTVGDGSSGLGVDRFTPVDATVAGSNIAQVSNGGMHTCALTTAGGVKCWGNNWFQQLWSGDTDSDGCTDGDEITDNPAGGGERSQFNFWDFFDTPDFNNYRDGDVDIDDLFAVVDRFASVGSQTSQEDAQSPPLGGGYHAGFDRGAVIGPHLWNTGPANGVIDIDDVFESASQFAHVCM